MAQMNVNLAFSADTGKAKAQIAELQSLLSKIAYTGSTTNVADSLQKDLQEASTAAKELQFHLNNAFNVSTGKFDLSMLDKSLKTSNANITDLSTKLLGAGATGQQAFVTLAQSISLADQPMLRVSKRMQDFAVTMKNTVKWQLSSSMLHGFMGAIQSAYGYAQDLNKSLTDIRIVTGYSTDQMAQFAEQANKAAKALSTTTTDYTNASLIYFQQGLSDAEVAARTDITVKMANAAGQSAEVVSEQLTAVWNNFADGSKSLEYYADVMTALGAATASSSDEISEGLSKFAAVAESVGLSYEYATAALTTITSNTRESADVVGNALKTLFARLQGLKLGETLEDGVDLNKYSEALDKAGISIFEQSGELKAMDNILSELAGKWDTMSNAQQVALAQTVAGVRQYTQLIALMENWDSGDSDSFMANLNTIENAEGALQNQADIYADSWEAAQKRVQAAAEGIYQSLLDDDFFISISNGFANLLGGLDAFIDNAGGVKTVLIGIAGIVSSVFANQIPQALDNFKYNLEIVTKGTQAAYDRMQTQMAEATQTAFNEYITSGGTKGIKEDSATGYAIQQANELTVARNKLAMVSDKMSASEKQLADMSLSIIQSRQEEVTALKQKNEAMQKSIELQKEEILQTNIGDKVSQQSSKVLLDDTVEDLKGQKQFYDSSAQRSGKKQKAYQAEADSYAKALEEIKVFSDQFDARKEEIRVNYDELHKIIFEGFQKIQNGDTIQPITSEQLFGELDFQNPKNAVDNMIQSIERLGATATDKNKDTILEAMRDEVGALSSTIPDAIQKATGLKQIFNKIASKSSVQNLDEMASEIEELKKGLKAAKIEGKDFENILKGFHGNKISTLSQAMKTLESNESDAATKAEALQRLLNSFNPGHIVRLSEAFGGLVGFLGSTVAIGNSVKSMLMSLGDPDLSGWEKFSSVIMGITTILPSAKAAFEGLNTAIQGGNQWIAAQNLLLGASSGAFGANAAAISKKTMVEIASYIATQKATGALEKDIIATVTAKLMTQGLAQEDAKAAAAAMVHAGGVEFLNGALTVLGGLLTWIKSHLLAVTLIAAAVVAVFTLISSAIKNYNENVRENAEKSREAAEATKEQVDSNQKLVDSYGAALNAYEEVKDAFASGQATTEDLTAAQENLANSALETAAALGVEGAALAKLSGNYEQLTKDIINAQKKDIEQGIQNEESAKNLTGNEFILDMREGVGNVVGTTYSAYIGAGMDASDESYFQNIDYKQYDKIYGGANGLNITSLSTVEDMMQAYEEAQNIYNQALENMTAEEMNKSEIFNNLKNWLEKSSESYEAYKAAEDNIQNYKVKSASLTEFEGIENAYDISSIEEYDKYASAMIENIAKSQNISQGTEEWDELTEAVHAYLGALEGVSDFATQSKAFDEIAKKTGIARDELIKYYNELTPEEQELFFSIAFNSVDDIAELDKEIELLQAVAAGQAIQVKLDVVSEGLELLDDDATTEEIVAWAKKMQEAYGEAFNLEEFLAKSSNEQLNYLRDLQNQAKIEKTENRESQITEYQEAIQRTQEDMAAQETAYQQASDDRVRNQNRLDALEQYKTDYNKAVSEGETFDFSSLGETGITNIDQLNNAITATEELITANDETINSYNELASQVDNYKQAVDNLEIEKQVENAYGWRDALREEAEALDISYDEIQDYAAQLRRNHKELENNIELSEKIALAEKKQAKAADDLIDNYKDYAKVLKKAKLDSKIKDTEEYAQAIESLRKDLSLLTGYSEEIFTDDFVNSDEVQKALLDISNGVAGATERLKVLAAAQEIKIKTGIEIDQVALDALQAEITNLNNQDIEIGAIVDEAPALDALANLLQQAGWTTAQIQEFFNNLGWQPEIGYEEVQVKDLSTHASNGFVEVVEGNPYEGYTVVSKPVSAFSGMDQEEWVKVPKIGSKSAGGGGYKKVDPIGNSSSKTPSSGGGGGGGGSKPKHAEKKNDSDKERYHTLNNQLEDLESQYDSISDAADRAFGQDKLDNIDKQIEKTQELIDKNEEYLAEAEKNASIDKSVMEAYYNKSIGGPAIQYDENGNITNFDEIQDAAYAKYNQMAETYDEESNEWIQFEKDYEQFMKYLELYEESTDLVRDKKAEAERLAAEKIDLELEKVQYSIEIQLEVPEDQLKVIDFQLERIEDDAFNSAESMNLLIQKANLFNREIETTKQGLIDTLGVTLSDQEINQILSGNMDGIDTSKFTEDQVSAIREYKDSLLELNQELLDIQQQIEDEVMETFEEYHEELDRGMEKFDHYNNMLESYQNIVDIVGKDVLGLDNEALADISEAQVENSINQLKASKDAYDSLQKQADDALQKQQEAEIKAALARAKGDEETAKSYEEDAEFWKETYTEMNEAAVEAQEEMMDSWGNTLEAIATQFELAVERAVKAFNDAIYEFGGLEGMSDDFSRQKEMDDMYLEDYQQIYELSKLTRDINNTIDDTENISGKQKLKKLLEEINQLQEDGVEMSEYDLEYLQAEYNLRLAELELEEAQKAKDTVRLSRDNEGNWSYVYTQNTDAVDAAQQKYEDALYAMQDLSSNYIDEMSEQLIATSQEMQEALANVRVEDFASQEEYYAELARIEAQYQEQMAAQEAELNKAIANNKELYDTDWKNYSEATGYKISKAEEFATKFSDTLLGSLVGSEEATSNFTAIVGEATDSLVQGLANAAATYYTNLNTAMEAAGTSTSEFADLLAEDVEAIKTDSAEAADAVAQMAEKMDEEMTKITERVQKFQEDYGREIDKIIAKNLEMVETFNDMLEHLSIDPDQINVTYDISRSQDDETVEVPEGTASGYTGMYTGDWGSSEGRVAVLHEKELLLNQDDTVNMLEALRISKYMLEVLNANAQMMSQGMGAMLPASIDNSISEVLEQQVSIVAEFPNAVNHSEIEEAFDTLINRAAQYANRK